MPFIQRVVEPIYLSRRSLHREEGASLVTDYELEAVTNITLSSALRQLASLVVIANDIFDDLAKQLQDVCERSTKLRARIDIIEEKVSAFDPKTVTVPEGDLCEFSARTQHFSACRTPETRLFAAESRPLAVRRLYESAARTPVHVMRQLDRHRADGRRSSRFFVCTPVLGVSRRRHVRLRSADIDIETRTPAAVAALRRWTSAEALGDVTVLPDCSARLSPAPPDSDDETDHRLPSPEEQLATVALRFPGHVVAVDVSGRAFKRMSLLRRSQQLGPTAAAEAAGGTSTSRSRRSRHRRRNTLAGTDRKEIRQALAQEAEREAAAAAGGPEAAALRATASSELLSHRPSTSASSTPEADSGQSGSKKSFHLRNLKQWAGKARLRLTRRDATPTPPPAPPQDLPPTAATTTAGTQPQQQQQPPVNIYESVGSHLPIAASSGPLHVAVKLREKREPNGQPLHSSSGNWSASSESGRASLGSSTSTSHPPRSTTTVSSATGAGHTLNTSASSSGTLTPDLAASVADHDSSSVYSCDTEGYYTSFHLDSGLKTLREEDPCVQSVGSSGTLLPQPPLHTSSALSGGGSPGRGGLTADSEYELFGKGSTSTTTSSAGTVCTTLQLSEGTPGTPGPAPPERKSSLLVAADVHADSPDSGHNTSSSPAQSASPPGTLTVRSRSRSSDCDFSESDLEAVERVERIRVKTAINSSRIPSMCVITPPQSDDEEGPPPRRPPTYDKQLSSDSDTDWSAVVASRRERRPHLNLNGVIGKVKDALVGKKSPEQQRPAITPTATPPVDAGDYVRIADVRPTRVTPSSPRLYSNTRAAAASPVRETEYVSLNELPPPSTTRSGAPLAAPVCSSPPPSAGADSSLERRRRQGARVTLDSEGKVIFSSDSLRRRGKPAHTTFEPGPYVKETTAGSPLATHRAPPQQPPPTSPQLGKVIIRAAVPAACVSAQRPLSPPPAQQQTGPRQGAYVNVQSPTRSAPDAASRDGEEGKIPTNGTKAPPRYINPPEPTWSNTVSHNSAYSSSHQGTPYWTLPARRPSERIKTDGASLQMDKTCQYAGSGRFNTIATSVSRNNLGTQYLNYNDGKEKCTSVGANAIYSQNDVNSSSHNSQNKNMVQHYTQIHRVALPDRQHVYPTPASVPKVPPTTISNTKLNQSVPSSILNRSAREAFFSSTPTKDSSGHMDMSTNFSPIKKYNQSYNNPKTSGQNIPLAQQKASSQNLQVRTNSPRLVSPPKTSMTAEELFAAIHKSKKRLNIKTDIDSYSRSASPSCSSAASLSPGSSESSLCGLQGKTPAKYVPEKGTLAIRNDGSHSRHSWSPNAKDEADIHQNLERYSPIQTAGSRQSWACDRLRPPQQLSRNDFKRLLLQQSSKSNVANIPGYSNGKLSAVEQLRLSRQKAASATISNSNCQTPRSPAEKRNGGPKFVPSPRSLANWRFPSPRTDVLSSTIPEDCAEDEDASVSPQNSPLKNHQPKLSNLSISTKENNSINPIVRRPLMTSFATGGSGRYSTLEFQKNGSVVSTMQQHPASHKWSPSTLTLMENKRSFGPKTQNLHDKDATSYAQIISPELLSPLNVKENLNSNQINLNISCISERGKNTATSGVGSPFTSSFKSTQLIQQQQNVLRAASVKNQSLERTRINFYNGSPGRSVLGALDSKSPSSTLETAL